MHDLVADKIRLAIQGTSLKYGEAKIKVTVSAGVGEAVGDGHADLPAPQMDGGLPEATPR